MDEVHFKPRRVAAGFKIEDTRSGELLEGEEHDDFFVASQAAAAHERTEWAEGVARRLEEAGSDELAAELREGIPRDVLWIRLREGGEASGKAAQILGQAPKEP